LKNGLIVRHPQNNDVQLVQILCEQEAADRLLDFAQRVDPNAAQEIVSSVHYLGGCLGFSVFASEYAKRR
jgi:hypothetical protein